MCVHECIRESAPLELGGPGAVDGRDASCAVMGDSIQHHTLEVNGIRLHVAEQGRGPLVILCHGWPELWYSWRHQIPALAAAGFRAVAPDMRGFGQSDAPEDGQAYTILHTVGDVVQLVAALGEQQAIVIGHDWGAPVAWNAALMRPDVFRAVVGMSVPHRPRALRPTLASLRERGLDRFYYFYFQTPAAEQEFARDPWLTTRKLMFGMSAKLTPQQDHPLMVPEGRGFLDRMAEPEGVPDWLSEADIDVFAREYQRTGYRGGLQWYRNIDRNWELTAPFAGAKIQQPALFIAGTRDPVLAGKAAEEAERLQTLLPQVRSVLVEGAGHWIQQERWAVVNEALLEFLRPFAR
jgi:pimeloyl-ACP methyl ester carboxylesterase